MIQDQQIKIIQLIKLKIDALKIFLDKNVIFVKSEMLFVFLENCLPCVNSGCMFKWFQ